jgi:hypothetical protein
MNFVATNMMHFKWNVPEYLLDCLECETGKRIMEEIE